MWSGWASARTDTVPPPRMSAIFENEAISLVENEAT